MRKDFSDVLDTLAQANGAALYWQLPNQDRVKAAIDAGAIRVDAETDLAVHPDAMADEEGAYSMPDGSTESLARALRELLGYTGGWDVVDAAHPIFKARKELEAFERLCVVEEI